SASADVARSKLMFIRSPQNRYRKLFYHLRVFRDCAQNHTTLREAGNQTPTASVLCTNTIDGWRLVMKHLRYLAFLGLLLLTVVPALAQEIICPPPCPLDAPCPAMPTNCVPRQPGVFTNPEWLKIDYHRVTVDVNNQIATTNVDMQFTN